MGEMMKRLGAFLASRPDRAAVVVITLLGALIVVLAGLLLQYVNFGQAPYPSEDVPLSLVDGKVVYVQTWSDVVAWGDSWVPFNYTGMRIAFQMDWGGFSVGSVRDFGDQSLLSTGSRASYHEGIASGSTGNVTIDITDSTGDGSFSYGDLIAFDIQPLSEHVVYTFGLCWVHAFGETIDIELSFALHHSEFYAWNSRYLPTENPWWE